MYVYVCMYICMKIEYSTIVIEYVHMLMVWVLQWVHVHVLMRNEKEGRKKEESKQQGEATQHTQGSH